MLPQDQLIHGRSSHLAKDATATPLNMDRVSTVPCCCQINAFHSQQKTHFADVSEITAGSISLTHLTRKACNESFDPDNQNEVMDTVIHNTANTVIYEEALNLADDVNISVRQAFFDTQNSFCAVSASRSSYLLKLCLH